jgi:hypothetical protein
MFDQSSLGINSCSPTLFDEVAATLTNCEEVWPFESGEPFGARTMLQTEPSHCSVTAL